MTQLFNIVQYLDKLLKPEYFKDAAINGLQVENSQHTIDKIAFAVDASSFAISEAGRNDAQLLIVHHGLFWGKQTRITGPLAKRVESLYHHKCSLYASHLPLDANREVGNNFECCRLLDLQNLRSFFVVDGQAIGCLGDCVQETTLEELIQRCEKLRTPSTKSTQCATTIMPFGKKQIRTVAVVTGSGSSGLQAAFDAAADVLISGEPKHEAFHTAQELAINAIFAGHYRTETLGVRALARHLEKEFKISTLFIDEDSNI